MIKTVDKNEDGKISYSEFRVIQEFYFYLTQAVRTKKNSGIESDIKTKQIIKYNSWQEGKGPIIIHDVTSVECNKEDDSLPTFIYARYIHIYF